MITPISVNNLIEGGWRSVLSVAGIGIAVVLIFMQLGFLGAVLDTAVVFYRNLEFDLVVRSPDFYQFIDPKKITRDDLEQVVNVDGVEAVEPFHVSLGNWTYADESVERGILIMGVRAAGRTFRTRNPSVRPPNTKLLNSNRKILIDTQSRPGFLGEGNKQPISDQNIGLEVEINKKRCVVSGLFEIGTGLAADGAILINERGYADVVPGYSSHDVGMGLIRLSPELRRRPTVAQQRIESALFRNGPDRSSVDILTRSQIERGEIMYWITNTPVGLIFITGVIVAFIVGGIIVYIVLSADITRQLGEYATLKAMGYRDSYLNRIVFEQALILGVISYVGAFLAALVLYEVVGSLAQLPIRMTVGRQVLVFVSTLAMCILSGAIASQKLRRADPADLF
jgi:putative ABC transport system permease protein